MKITMNIDCTPEEARHFFGFPDVKPMQDAVMKRIEQQMMDAVAASSPTEMLRTWMPYMPQTPEQFQDAMMRFYRTAFDPSARREQ